MRNHHGVDYHGVVGPDGQFYAAPRGLSDHQFTQDDSHVFFPAANGSFNAVRRAEEHLNIQQMVDKQIGTWLSILDKDQIKIWDGKVWFYTSVRRVLDMDIMPHGRDEPFTPEQVEALKSVVQADEDEAERMALRRLLEEAQAGGRE